MKEEEEITLEEENIPKWAVPTASKSVAGVKNTWLHSKTTFFKLIFFICILKIRLFLEVGLVAPNPYSILNSENKL